MSDLDKRISDALDNGAEYLVMGEIAAHTGLLVSQAPRNNSDYDIIVNNIDLSKGCMIEVIHSRDEFHGTIKSTDYDFLVFIYAPSEIENGIVKPKTGKDNDETRGMYVFPRAVVKTAVDAETGAIFHPVNIKVDGVIDNSIYKKYRKAFHLILEMVPNNSTGFS